MDIFTTKVRREPAAVEPMKIVVDETSSDSHVIDNHLVGTLKINRKR